MTSIPGYVASFADQLRRQSKRSVRIGLGELAVEATRADLGSVQYNTRDFELLQRSHDYRVEIGGTSVGVSAQLYLNTRYHFRLFAFVRCLDATGMTFSLNLTTAKGVAGVIGLTQRIRFTEGRSGTAEAARAVREAKARLFADVLARCGISVSDNLEVQLGTYSAQARRFLDTTPSHFMSQFIAIALLKGHFQGNKGYQFAALPRFDDSFAWRWNSGDAVRERLTPNARGQRGSRAVPLGLRYHVLERDGGACVACGAAANEGALLHVDHIVPHSLGGLTVLANLQTLCCDCNLGKGNRSETDHRKPVLR